FCHAPWLASAHAASGRMGAMEEEGEEEGGGDAEKERGAPGLDGQICAPGRPAPAHGRARGWSGRVGRRGGRRRRGGARARRGHACPCLCRGAAVCACRWRTKGGEGGGEGGGGSTRREPTVERRCSKGRPSVRGTRKEGPAAPTRDSAKRSRRSNKHKEGEEGDVEG
ncbi:unnamed protein product, partial [Prorocentrum cordatum]